MFDQDISDCHILIAGKGDCRNDNNMVYTQSTTLSQGQLSLPRHGQTETDAAVSAQRKELKQFVNLPPELIHYIFLHLDIPDLLNTSRTNHTLRTLSLDPLLHAHRLRLASWKLSHRLSHRPSRASISPPNAWICLNKTNVLSRSISRSLVKIRLGHSLERRPSIDSLVYRAILPAGCYQRVRTAPARCDRNHTSQHSCHDEMNHVLTGSNNETRFQCVAPTIITRQQQVKRSLLRDRLGRKLSRRPDVKRVVEMGIIPAECVSPTTPTIINSANGKHQRNNTTHIIIAPGLVAMRRKVIKEKLKDGLRAWVEHRGWREQKRRQGEWEDCDQPGEGVRSVKTLVRRLSAKISSDSSQRQDVKSKLSTTASLSLSSTLSSSSPSTLPLSSSSKLNNSPQQLKRRKVNDARWGRQVEEKREKEKRRRAIFVFAPASSFSSSSSSGHNVNTNNNSNTNTDGKDNNHGGGNDRFLLLVDPNQPTRAHVLGLRTFWEGVIKAAAG